MATANPKQTLTDIAYICGILFGAVLAIAIVFASAAWEILKIVAVWHFLTTW
jgi:hypothetical protein